MSVMYLMDMKKYEEAETYTASVLSRLNYRPQEKFLILAVFMILICILLYCVLSDMLKKSNTEMELAFLQKQKQLKQEQDYSLQIRRQDTQDFQSKTAQEFQNFQSLLEQGKHEQADTAIKKSEPDFSEGSFSSLLSE